MMWRYGRRNQLIELTRGIQTATVGKRKKSFPGRVSSGKRMVTIPIASSITRLLLVCQDPAYRIFHLGSNTWLPHGSTGLSRNQMEASEAMH